jgi:O-antigen/teichoic acid export membrane protein
LLIVGLAIWGLLFLNMDNAIHYLGKEYAPMKSIFVIMGFAKLIDLGTGANSQILLLSKYWRLDFFTNMTYVLISLPLNYILIHKYGIYGPAWANLTAMTAFNTIRFLYIWKLFRIQPFTVYTLFAIGLAVICIVLVNLMPVISNIYIDVMIRSAIFAGIFAGSILLFNVSPDITGLYQNTLQQFKKK